MTNKKTAAEQAVKRMNLITRICVRAEEMGIRKGTLITAMMDVDLADQHFKMKLTDWLNADVFNFAHDFVGIQNHIDRITETFDDRFLPRFAGRDESNSTFSKDDVVIEITSDTRQIDAWVQGIIKSQNDTYEFCAKVFDEGSEYGINKGRVSKLHIRCGRVDIVKYDRGWDIKPETEYKSIYSALIKALKKLPKVFE